MIIPDNYRFLLIYSDYSLFQNILFIMTENTYKELMAGFSCTITTTITITLILAIACTGTLIIFILTTFIRLRGTF